jgi:hypothetical protein
MGIFSDIDVQMQGDDCVWFSTSSGRIELSIPYELACRGYHMGACDDDISELLKTPLIKAQLLDISSELLRSELKEYGAWDALELSNHADNLARILWIACGDIVENKK